MNYANMRHDVIARCLRSTNDLEGCVAEFGVFQGESARIILQNTDKHVYLLDTFEGIPHVNEHDNHHKVGDFSNTDVQHVVNQLSPINNNFTIIKGIFPDSITHSMLGQKYAFIHIDCDVYESYIEVLKTMYPRLSQGGVILFDDYHAPTCLGAKKAVDEFLKHIPEQLRNTDWYDSAYIVKGY